MAAILADADTSTRTRTPRYKSRQGRRDQQYTLYLAEEMSMNNVHTNRMTLKLMDFPPKDILHTFLTMQKVFQALNYILIYLNLVNVLVNSNN